MAELTIEQKKALARARAKLKLAGGNGSVFQSDLNGLSEAFQTAAQGQMGPPMPPDMVLRQQAAKYFANNDQGAAMATAGGVAQGGTFGLSDEIAARFQSLRPDVTYDQALAIERGRLDAARANHPVAAYGGEIGGAIAVPVGNMATTGSLAARAGKSSALAALLGGLYGFGTGEGGMGNRMESAKDTGLISGAIGAAAPVVGNVLQTALTNRAANRAIDRAARTANPAADARAAYKAVEDANVSIRKPDFWALTQDTIAGMKAKGLDTGGGALNLTPQSSRVADIMSEMSSTPGPIKFSDLELLRRKAAIPAGNFTNKADSALGSQVINNIDEFINNLKPEQVAAGDATNLAVNIAKARASYAKASKLRMVEDAIANGENYLSGTSSGIRNQFRSILKNKKMSRGLTPVERKAMERVANGRGLQSLIHLAGGGMGQIASIGGGTALGSIGGPGIGSLIGTATGALAAKGARALSEKITRNEAEKVVKIIAAGALPESVQGLSPAAQSLIERIFRSATVPASAAVAR